MIVVDVSAVIPFLMHEDVEIKTALSNASHIMAPDLYMAESGNAILQYVKHELITLEEAYRYIGQSRALIDQFVDLKEDSESVFTTAHENGVSFYDAQYLFIALSLDAPVLSKDAKLNRAADELGIKYVG